MNDLTQIGAAVVGTVGGIYMLLFVMAAIDPKTDRHHVRQGSSK